MGGRGSGGSRGGKSGAGGGMSENKKAISQATVNKTPKASTDERLTHVNKNNLNKWTDDKLKSEYKRQKEGYDAEVTLNKKALSDWATVNHKLDKMENLKSPEAKQLFKQSDKFGTEERKRMQRAKTRKYNYETLQKEVLRRAVE